MKLVQRWPIFEAFEEMGYDVASHVCCLARPLGLASSQLVRVRGRAVREGIPGGVRAGLLFIGITAGSTMGNRSSMLRL